MKRAQFIHQIGLTTMSLTFLQGFSRQPQKKKTSIRLIRHATLLIEINGLKLIVDPMLSAKESMDPVGNAANTFRIPMVGLPFGQADLTSILKQTDAILLTHTHRDHWDKEAIRLIDKNKLIFCQPQDEILIREQGFKKVTPVTEKRTWEGLDIFRTGGQHGTGEIGKTMGPVSGFVVRTSEECIYIAGDTIWCDEVRDALLIYKPGYTIVNAGAAQFVSGGPITMTPADVKQVCNVASETRVIAVHMDTVNHCLINRNDFRQAMGEWGLLSRVTIPKDGQVVNCS